MDDFADGFELHSAPLAASPAAGAELGQDASSVNRKPLVVTCAVIVRDDGLFLAALRPEGKSLGGKWEFPGGKVEPGETPSDALRRELREELEIDVRIEKPLSVVRHDYAEFTIELHPFIVRIVEGIPVAREHAALKWIRLKDAGTLDWAAADLPVLEEL